jgi:hypothetical protein
MVDYKRALFPLKVAVGFYGMWGALGAYRGIQWYNITYEDSRQRYLWSPSSFEKPVYSYKKCSDDALKELALYMNPTTSSYAVCRELKGQPYK